jgi:hypothetical protein
MSGNKSEIVSGFKRGIVGLVSNSVAGVSNSVGRLTGTWYMSLKDIGGRPVSELDLANPETIGGGFWDGGKGFVAEIGHGFSGIYFCPRRQIREDGASAVSFAKGSVKGLLGLALFPASGTLRLVQSASTGVKNTARGVRHVERCIRYPRYITFDGQMKDYNS